MFNPVAVNTCELEVKSRECHLYLLQREVSKQKKFQRGSSKIQKTNSTNPVLVPVLLQENVALHPEELPAVAIRERMKIPC